jgi:MFS family permease
MGALCYGYDNTYYNGVLAMQQFKNNYGTHHDTNGYLKLPSSFQAVTTSAIYIGDLLGAIIAAPVNDHWGRKATFWLASFCVLIGGVCQVADTIHHPRGDYHGWEDIDGVGGGPVHCDLAAVYRRGGAICHP